MKVRFDGLDVTAMVAHVQAELVGRRIVNVYDGVGSTSSGSGGGGNANEGGGGGGDTSTYVIKLDNSGGESRSTATSTTAASSATSGNATKNNDADNSGSKGFLLMESGVRFHPLDHFGSEASKMPTPFCSKLRKHLRGLRLEQCTQLGTDRVVVFQFGVGQSRHAIVLELYARGNLILVDRDYRILALLRSHVYHHNRADDSKEEGDTNDKGSDEKEKGGGGAVVAAQVQVGHVYPVAYATTVTAAANNTGDSSRAAEQDDEPASSAATTGILSDDYKEWIDQEMQQHLQQNNEGATVTPTTKKGKKQKRALTLKTLLLKPGSGISRYGPALIEHCILKAGLPPHESLAVGQGDGQGDGVGSEGPLQMDDDRWQTLRTALREEGRSVLRDLGTCGGYILYEDAKNSNSKIINSSSSSTTSPVSSSDLPHPNKMLQEFVPYLFLQHADDKVLRFDNFGAAVADFYAQLSRQRQLAKAQVAEVAAEQRLEKIRRDQSDRLVGLETEQIQLHKEAVAVQSRADDVDKALVVINSALDSGMDWDQLEQLVDVEQQKRNPIAMLVHELDLEHDAMILRLPVEADGTADDPKDQQPYLDVRVSLKETAHANANTLFARYRASKEKALKTVEASSMALKAAEENAMRQLAEAHKKNIALPLSKRKPAWYEKFHWFITSDNYLVLGGKDAHQNELLVKRYLRPGDAYLHADVHGAASCILRAKRRRGAAKSGGGWGGGRTEPVPLSDQALWEAGNFTICRSSAWSSRMITSAWWVEADQVSKTAPTGEYLTVGSFMVRGKKNFLPPSQLEMGLAVLFRLGDDDSIARHKNDRRDFALMALGDESLTAAVDSDIDEAEDEPPTCSTAKKSAKSSSNGTVVSEDSPRIATAAPQKVEALGRDGASEEPALESEPVDDADSRLDEVKEDDGHSSEENIPREAVPDDNGSRTENTAQTKKKGLSARDRRLIKKHGSLEEAEKVLAAKKQGETRETTNDVDLVPTANASSEPPITKEGMKRGKKTKMKRAMRRYGDQDDEDRELAMLALQGGEKAKKAERQVEVVSEAQLIVAAETNALLVKDASEAAAQLTETVRTVLAECVTVKSDEGEGTIRWDKFDADTLEQLSTLEPEEAQVVAAKRLLNLKSTTRIDNFSASLSGILRTIRKYGYERIKAELDAVPADNAKRKTKEEKVAEDNKWKETLAQEGVVDSDNEDDAVDDTVELFKLTGKPLPDDLLLYAVSVCAPYQTLSKYSYRVKLTPGNMKRGKAAKQCLEMLLKGDNAKSTPTRDREKDLIKKVPDNDWIQTICSDVKISAAGASKVAKKQKSKNKKTKK